MEWYKEFEHIGYDLDGEKIGKPLTGDELDNFLDKMDNPNYWSAFVLLIYTGYMRFEVVFSRLHGLIFNYKSCL